MAIEKIAERDPLARAKMNDAIDKANLVDSKASLADLRSLPSPLPVKHRPGDALLDFGLSLADGEAGGILPLPEAFLRYDENGRVVRLIGANIVAPRHLYALEPGRRYRVTFVVQRRVNSPDPDNDAIRCALAWYSQAKGALVSPAFTTIENLVGVTTGTGRITVQAVVARAPRSDVDFVSPATARYCRPYVQTFGTLVQNDVEVISWDDITDVVAYAPDVSSMQAELDALKSLDLGDRVSVLEGFSTSPNFFRVETIGALAAANVPVSVDAVEVLGYYAVGDGGDHKRVRVGSSTATTQADAGGAHWEIVGDVLDVRAFGAKGDATDTNLSGADDAAAIQKALHWLETSPGSSVLTFSKGRYRIASPCAAGLDAKPTPASILMTGSIKPDAGIGYAITIRNARDGHFDLRVYGGGSTADYSQADPANCNEAFRFENLYNSVIYSCRGGNYAGRMLRITSGTLGSLGHPSQLNTIHLIDINSTAATTDSESERMAQGVGQAFYIDTDMSAFGTINKVSEFWGKYGFIIENTYDVTVNNVENLTRGVSGIELRGIISFWGGHWEVGSELDEGLAPTLIKIIPSTTVQPQQCSFEQVFVTTGQDGLYAENVGSLVGQGLSIGKMQARTNYGVGLRLKNCSKFVIGQYQAWRNGISLRLEGACFFGQVHIHSTESKTQAVQIDSTTAGTITITGQITGVNSSLASAIGAVNCETVNPIFFENLHISSELEAYAYKLVANNNAHIFGGSVLLGGSAELHNSGVIPIRCNHVRGWLSEWRGKTLFEAGESVVTVLHQLPNTPDSVHLTPRGAAGIPGMTVTNVGSTSFDIATPAPAANDVEVQWRAWLDYAG